MTFSRRLLSSVSALVILGAFGLPAAVAQSNTPAGYHLVKTVPVGGEGFWDYLAADSAARRLYVTRGTHVMVFDLDTLTQVGDIPNLHGIHGVAIASPEGRGYISDGGSAEAVAFDLKTLRVLGKVKTGAGADAILYDPATHRVFTWNGRAGSATAIDATAKDIDASAVGTIVLGGKPEFATSDGAGSVYVNLENKSEVLKIDAKTLKITATWPLAPCEEPSGMAIDAAHHRLVIGCGNKMMAIVNADSGAVIATPAIGAGVDANGFDPGTHLAFSSNGRDANLTVVQEKDPNTFVELGSVPTAMGARTMAVDLKTHNVILVTAKFGPPPAATTERPHPRPSMVPGSFELLVVAQ
ncbi:MAG: YncE family protein [Terriglobales bacterium]